MKNAARTQKQTKRVQDRAGLYLGEFLESDYGKAGRQVIMRALRETCRLAALDLRDCATDPQRVKVFLPALDAAIILLREYGKCEEQLSKLRIDLMAAATGSKEATSTALRKRNLATLRGYASAIDDAVLWLANHNCSTDVLKRLRRSLACMADGKEAPISLIGAQAHGKRYSFDDEMFRASAIVLAQKRPDLYGQIAARVREHLNVDLARLIENFEGQGTGGLTLQRLVATATHTYEREGIGGLNFYLFSTP